MRVRALQSAAAAPKAAFRYKPQFGVIVICRDERDQARVYRELNRGPRKVKVVCT